MSDILTLDDFKDNVGHTYVIGYDLDGDDIEDQIKLELIECTAYEKYKHAESKRTPFILVFKGPEGFVLPDQMYAVKSEEGDHEIPDLFLSSIGPSEDHGELYEACFN